MGDIEKLKIAFEVLDEAATKSMECFTSSSETIAEYAKLARKQKEVFIKNVQEGEFSCMNGFYDKPLPVSWELLLPVDEKEEKISSLKKRIKHCKNHMERKKLQQELNALYKEKKKHVRT